MSEIAGNITSTMSKMKRNEPVSLTNSPKKWIEATEAIGIILKVGRYGGTHGMINQRGDALPANFCILLIIEKIVVTSPDFRTAHHLLLRKRKV